MEQRWLDQLSQVGMIGPSYVPPPNEPAEGRTDHEFDRIYVVYRILLRKIAVRKFAIPRPEADTLVQDVFATYLANRREVRDVHRYLIGAICNASRQFLRNQTTEAALFCDATVCAATPDDEVLNGVIQNAVIRATLTKLGPSCREALRQFYLEGMKPKAIADERETSPGYVRRLLTYCRKRAQAIYRELEREP